MFSARWPIVDGDAALAQPRHVVVVGQVRALHLVAERRHDFGDAAHADAADADEMDGADVARQFHSFGFPCKLFGQIGEALGGIRLAMAECSGRRLSQHALLRAQACQKCGKALRLQAGLWMDPAGACRCETLGIAQLVVVQRMRQRHHDGRPADDAQFGDGGCAGAADHQMRRRDPGGHVHEEGLQLAVEVQLPIGRPHGLHVLGANLLRHLKAGPLIGSHGGEDPGHEVAEELCALAAAEDQQPEAPRCRIGGGAGFQDQIAHGISGDRHLVRSSRRKALQIGEGRGNRIGISGQHPVGPAHDGILVVDAGGDLQIGGGQDRREGRIAAETDDGPRPQRLQDRPRLTIAAEQAEQPARQKPRLAERQGGRRHDVSLLRPERTCRSRARVRPSSDG